MGTVSLDSSFRLWDVESGASLLLQDGHARDVMGLSFQCDGSLAATCDQSGICRIWDLRSGRSALVLQVGARRGCDAGPREGNAVLQVLAERVPGRAREEGENVAGDGERRQHDENLGSEEAEGRVHRPRALQRDS